MAEAPRRIWLVGLSGAGKSTVGPILARRLGYGFIDLDDEIEELAGETIPRVFRHRGEAEFRRLEARAATRAATAAKVVVATGGGWMARRELDRTSGGRVRIWLRVRPESAIHRLVGGGTSARPLLAGPNPEAALAALLAEREAAYAEAELVLETEGREPEEVAEAAVRALRRFRTRGSTDDGGEGEMKGTETITETKTVAHSGSRRRS